MEPVEKSLEVSDPTQQASGDDVTDTAGPPTCPICMAVEGWHLASLYKSCFLEQVDLRWF